MFAGYQSDCAVREAPWFGRGLPFIGHVYLVSILKTPTLFFTESVLFVH